MLSYSQFRSRSAFRNSLPNLPSYSRAHTTGPGTTSRHCAHLRRRSTRGNCWHSSLLAWSPSLNPLRNLPRFDGILARSKAIMDKLEADTRVSVTVFPPKAGRTATAPPLFLPLHGGADIPGEHDRYWAAATDLGLVVAVARSSQRRSSDTFWWGGPPEPFDHDRSERDVKTAYDEVVTTLAFDVARVVLGGFSQGAVLA